MPRSPKATLTRLEFKLMQVIWRQGPSTVAAVADQLHPELAYTTVQTMLNILERKAHLTRKLKGRAYVYTAKMSEENALKGAVRDLIDRMFAGSPEALVSLLLRTGDVSPKAVATLARKVDRQASA